jgi:hypothetical protein
MEESTILYDKNDTKIIKLDDENYNLLFSIENKNINLCSIINFELIKLIYELNKDVCENMNLEKLDENNAQTTILIKNFFEDLGLPQKYTSLHILKTSDNKSITFDFSTIKIKKPKWVHKDMDLADIKNVQINCDFSSSQHKINFNCLINFKEEAEMPVFVQKVSIMIINKIVNRLKQFIENVRI